jgi:hypothetical protein
LSKDCRKATLVHILTVQVLCKLLYLSDYIFGFFFINSLYEKWGAGASYCAQN